MANSSSQTERILKRANPATIQNKFLVGYQGWFTCAGDGDPVGPGHHGWLHWFDKPIPDGGRPNLDLWPDVSSYSPSELYPVPGLKTYSGEQVFLFSSRNAKTVQRHFHWMAEHGVDGAFLQRFAGQCDLGAGNEGIRRIRDEVGDRVREAAEREGRVFAIMYDVTGVPADRIQHVLEQDWLHLMRNRHILDSPSYLKENGKPVIALWGFGFDNARHTPALVRAIAHFFRNATPGGAYLMAGTPTHWRTAEGDADRNPEFLDVWLNEFDAISPWTIGRYKTEDEADAFAESKLKPDADLIKRRNEEPGRLRKVDYIPVVFPGGSGYNLSEGKWGFNDIPRKGGKFLWKQLFNARRIGARIVYGAMWDEYDEGTVFMPAVPHKRNLPATDRWPFLALDADGQDLPSDWYMRICGFAGEVMRGERRIFESFPSKELQDYWSTRPKYEEVPARSSDSTAGYHASASGSGSQSVSAGSSSQANDGQSYEDWLAQQNTQEEEAPPPPYSLEAEEPVPALTAPAAASSGSTTSTAATAGVQVASAATGAGLAFTTSPPTSPTAGVYPSHASDHGQSMNPAVGINMQTQTRPSSQGYTTQPTVTGSAAPIAPVPHDPVTSLANSFGRVGLTNVPGSASGGSNPTPPSPPGGYQQQTGVGTVSPPPLHPSHPAAQQNAYGRPPIRPQPPAHSHSLPPSQSRPSSRPQTAHAQTPASTTTPQPPLPNPSSTGTWSQAQWPPAEWSAPATTSSPSPGPSHQPAHHVGGANLTRPQTYSAGGSYTRPSNLGPPPRPQTSQSHAPGGQASQGNPFPGGPGMPSSTAAPSGYTGPPGAPTSGPSPSSTFGGNPSTVPNYGPISNASGYTPPGMPLGPSGSSYPMPGGPASSYPGGPNLLGPTNASQPTGSIGFPPGPNHYPPYQSTPSFPNAASSTSASNNNNNNNNNNGGYGTQFSAPHHHHHPSWSGGGASGSSSSSSSSTLPYQHQSGLNTTSPPISPSALGGTFPNPNPNPSPASAWSDPARLPPPSTHYGDVPVPQPYPHGGQGGGAYYDHPSGPNPNAPLAPNFGGPPSSYGSPYGHNPNSPPPNAMTNLSGPTAWVPGGPLGPQGGPAVPPSLPPRPSNSAHGSGSAGSGSGSSSSGLGFPLATGATGSALGYALSAVDKVAGRKTREQLESQMGSLAQTGSKLFSKFTK